MGLYLVPLIAVGMWPCTGRERTEGLSEGDEKGWGVQDDKAPETSP